MNQSSGNPSRTPSPLIAQRELAVTSADKLPEVVAKSVGLHPLIYRKRIEHADPAAKPGDLVTVYDTNDNHSGYGFYNPRAELALRMVSHGPLPDEAFWDAKLQAAVSLRKEILNLDEVTNAYRVIHAEADGFPGLMVDKLGDVLSAEAFSLGMYQRADAILRRLAPMLGTKHTILRSGPASLAQEGFDGPRQASEGAPSRITVEEFGTRFRVDFAEGHKTGFFCDQRDNRKMLASFCKGKTVLDLCCYTGGFAIQAKKLGQAAEVTAVDLDEDPIALGKENANLNQVRVKFAQNDAFAFMRDMIALGRKYDVVILDPPKLIRNREEIEEGYRKHFDLNKLAMQLVAPGGVMVTCTCAGLLPLEEFLRLIYQAARQAGPIIAPATAERGPRHAPRICQILAKTGASSDHPIATHCPEGEYLQAVWMRLW